MIKRLFRWRHWRARARFWRKRALLAEGRLDAEMIRNREREDTLVTVPMRAMGLWGMPARDAPAPPIKQVNAPPKPIQTSRDLWDTLTWADQEEFQMYWKADAEAAGVPLQEAQRKFLAEVVLPRRMPLNDDPFANTN